MLVLSRRTRDRCALGVGGSYGQKDYWLGQLDPKSPQEPLRCADSEPRVLKSWLYDIKGEFGKDSISVRVSFWMFGVF
jgi:hypothetical protein